MISAYVRVRLGRAAGSRSQCRDPFGKRLAAGLTALVCGQAAINLAAVLGLAPLTGIPLPFVSYGGSSLVVALACGRASSLTSRRNGGRAGSCRCLIAAGGTAGHVLPALAVAEALRGRGVRVTFAGSPDRVEARLVPEAGYELDTFRISGLPRRPALAQARAALLAGRRAGGLPTGSSRGAAPTSCSAAAATSPGRWSSRRRRRRIPAALTEADAHLGLANRLAAPFAQARLPRVSDRRAASRRSTVVTGRPIPANARPCRATRRARSSGCRPKGRCCSSPARVPGARALNELAVEAFGARGPAVLHVSRRARLRARCARASRGRTTGSAVLDGLGAAYGAADLALMRAGRPVWELAAAGLPAVLVPYPFATADHQTKNARYFEAAGGAIVRARERARPRARDAFARCSTTRSGSRGCARRCCGVARPDAAERDRGGADRRLRPLEGRRLWFVGIGGAGHERATRCVAHGVGRRGRRLGPRRARSTSSGSRRPGSRSRSATSRERARRRRGRSSRPRSRRTTLSRTRARDEKRRSCWPSSSRCGRRSSSPARTARRRPRR